MGRVTTSMVGLWGMAKGAVIGTNLTGWIPVVGPALAIATGFIGGISWWSNEGLSLNIWITLRCDLNVELLI